jgi:hypothetical protein
VSSVEDRNGDEVEKSIKKQISRLAFGSLEMTLLSVSYKVLSLLCIFLKLLSIVTSCKEKTNGI